jgi:hypothetical protein
MHGRDRDSPRVEGLIAPEAQWRIEKVITLAQIAESTIVGCELVEPCRNTQSNVRYRG